MGGYVDCLLWRCMVIFDYDFVHGCVHDAGAWLGGCTDMVQILSTPQRGVS